MTPNQFRKIALGLDGAIESSHMQHPDFRANGKIFATIHPDQKQGMVKLAPDQQQEFMRAHPEMFAAAAGAWGRQGCTMVQFAIADQEVVGEAMTLAWQGVMAKPKRKAEGKRQKAKRKA